MEENELEAKIQYIKDEVALIRDEYDSHESSGTLTLEMVNILQRRVNRLKKLELDINCYLEVEDFLENGAGKGSEFDK